MIRTPGKDQIFITKLSEIILANLGNESFGVKELAQESGMSQYRLSRRLHEITGKTINQYIRELRLQKALEMLQNEEVTVSEIAYKVGFGSPTYFNTCFNELFGFPPGKVKKAELNNNRSNSRNFFHVTGNLKQKKFPVPAFIIISSLFLAVSGYFVYTVFFKNSSLDPGANGKHTEMSGRNKQNVNYTIKDVDGNVYHTVFIGTQVWLAEDLKTTRYTDGTPIPNVTDNKEWANLKSAAFCWPNNNQSNKSVYGALYNWYTTNTAKLCPVGWHVSTNSDWETLIDYCGGWEIAGGKLKETGTAHWYTPNIGATNETGFTALPAGGREGRGSKGGFSLTGRDLGYWCPPRCGDFRSLCSDRAWIYLTEGNASGGCCVRCVKNRK